MIMRFLLFYRMDWTDANPWFGLAGLAATVVLAGVLQQVLP